MRRVIAYDGSLTTNDHIVSVAWNSAENVFEDFAVFGPGRYTDPLCSETGAERVI